MQKREKKKNKSAVLHAAMERHNLSWRILSAFLQFHTSVFYILSQRIPLENIFALRKERIESHQYHKIPILIYKMT